MTNVVRVEYQESLSDILESPHPNARLHQRFLTMGIETMIPAHGFEAKRLHFRVHDLLTPYQVFDHSNHAYDDPSSDAFRLQAAAWELRQYTDGYSNEGKVRDRYQVVLDENDLTEELFGDVEDLRDHARAVGNVMRHIDVVLDKHLQALGSDLPSEQRDPRVLLGRYANQRHDTIKQR